MNSPVQSLLASGSKLWLDSIDPDLVIKNREMGATGATSNPIIVAELIKTGRFDDDMKKHFAEGLDDEAIAWRMTDKLVGDAEQVFLPVFQKTKGNDGYVSFELDPLLEDDSCTLSLPDKIERYVELGKHWSRNRVNRMIKIPATEAGLGAVEELVAAAVPLNVTLIFSARQYKVAREAAMRGAARLNDTSHFKSVYSIFVSRLDVYTEKHVANLSEAAQGQVGILNAKRIWAENRNFWREHDLALEQEIVFASTGTKKASDPCYKYVEAFAGSDIETNPPVTNELFEQSGHLVTKNIDRLPDAAIVSEIDEKVNFDHLEKTLMAEGLAKFASPQKELISLIRSKRR